MHRYNIIQFSIYIGYLFAKTLEDAFADLYDTGVEYSAVGAPDLDTSDLLSVILNDIMSDKYYIIKNNKIQEINKKDLNIDYRYLEQNNDDSPFLEDPFWEDDDDEYDYID